MSFMLLGAGTTVTAGSPPTGTIILLLSPSGADGSTTILDSGSLSLGAATRNGSPQIDTDILFGGNPTILNTAYGWDDQAALELGSKKWCIEGATQFSSVSGTSFLVCKWAGVGDSSWAVSRVGNTNFQFTYTEDGSTNVTVSASWTPTTGVFYEWCVTYDGNKIRLFIDGAMIGSAVKGAINIYNGPLKLAVASNSDLNNFLMLGSMGRLRITVDTDYGRGDAGYTPQAAGYYS